MAGGEGVTCLLICLSVNRGYQLSIDLSIYLLMGDITCLLLCLSVTRKGITFYAVYLLMAGRELAFYYSVYLSVVNSYLSTDLSICQSWISSVSDDRLGAIQPSQLPPYVISSLHSTPS